MGEPENKFAIQRIVFGQEVQALLTECELPTDDLNGSSDVLLFGSFADADLIGVVGLEIYGPNALLRSLAVTTAARGTGLGVALLEYAENYAQANGVTSIWLLTTTAAEFFENRGYVHASRSSAPESIVATKQFAGLCPSSSAFMIKIRG